MRLAAARSFARFRRFRGFTLIELLVALAIAVVVFAAVFLIYRVSAAAALSQHQIEQTAFAPAAAFKEIHRDIDGLMPETLDEQSRLVLKKNPAASAGEPVSDISFCTWRADPTNAVGMWAGCELIAWRVFGPGTLTASLVRLSRPLTGPGSQSAVTNYFLDGITRFDVQISDGKDWSERWPSRDAESKNAGKSDAVSIPRILRVEIGRIAPAGNVTNWTTDFFIPLGYSTTTRFERASAPALPVAPR